MHLSLTWSASVLCFASASTVLAAATAKPANLLSPSPWSNGTVSKWNGGTPQMSERERAFDHFHYEVMLGFQRLSKQEQDIIESASFDILTQMRSVPPQPVRPENKVQKRSHVKRVLFPLATSGMAYLIEQLGEDVVAAAIKDGKIIPHDASTAGTAAANAAKSGLVAAQGVPSAEVALLQKYGTYGAVFALGMVVAAFAMGKTVMFGDSKNSTAAAAIPTPPPPMTNVALHLYLSGNGTSVTSGDESLVHGQHVVKPELD